MNYSGAATAHDARKTLGKALEALQEDPDIPEDVMAVAQNIAQAVGALFESERASSEVDGKASVKSALGFLSQTLALLQDVRSAHRGIEVATEVIAGSMSALYPLTVARSTPPEAKEASGPFKQAPSAAPNAAAPKADARRNIQSKSGTVTPPPLKKPEPAVPTKQGMTPAEPPAKKRAPYVDDGSPRESLEVNIGATTESNFWVGFSGEVAEGGVFMSTYETGQVGTRYAMLVTLPGGFEFKCTGTVRFVRDPLDFASDSEPGMGIGFDELSDEGRGLVLRFIRKRPPLFFDA